MDNTINLGGYDITFMGTLANGDSETWIYKVTKNGTPSPPISNWGIELCFNPLHRVVSVTGPTIARIGKGQPCLPFNGNAVIWENLNNDNVNGTYTFTLKGEHQKASNQVAVYTGEFCHIAFITGPSCETKVKKEKVEKKDSSIEVSPNESVNDAVNDAVDDAIDDSVDDSVEVKNEQIFERQEPQQKQQEKKSFVIRGIKIF